eukprot:jgi/Mesen1/1007/ME000120S00163
MSMKGLVEYISMTGRAVVSTSCLSREGPYEQEASSPTADSFYGGGVGASSIPKEPITELGGGSSGGAGGIGGGGGGGGGGWSSDGSSQEGDGAKGNNNGGGFFAAISKGWNDRVSADPQFVFKVLTEQIIGVTACVVGDMASRPNFGLNELDFVFSTLVVGSILNFALMYLLAPTGSASVAAAGLPGIFTSCPAGHMFEPGAYSLGSRLGTFVYKGVQFASVGFVAGLAGTVLSNALLQIRKTLQPDFELQNDPPPTLLNAGTWALHMGISSNLRYQCLMGLDQVLVRVLSPVVFRGLAFGIRGANNIIGGSTFVMLAKLTGSQKSDSPPPPVEGEPLLVEEQLPATPSPSI